MDDRVVEAVASQAVDLVDDAVLDGVLGDVVEHVLEGAALRRLGGLARLDELLDDDGAKLVSLSLSRLALGGDRQALFKTVSGGLVLGGDPKVADRRDQTIRVSRARGLLDLGGGGGELAQLAHIDSGREGRESHGDRLSRTPERGLVGRQMAVTSRSRKNSPSAGLKSLVPTTPVR
nr:hypothetical protein [Kocuria salsicia]